MLCTDQFHDLLGPGRHQMKSPQGQVTQLLVLTVGPRALTRSRDGLYTKFLIWCIIIHGDYKFMALMDTLSQELGFSMNYKINLSLLYTGIHTNK